MQMLSEKAVMINIYQGFLLAAIKFVANVKALSLGNRCRKYTKFFFREFWVIYRIFKGIGMEACQ